MMLGFSPALFACYIWEENRLWSISMALWPRSPRAKALLVAKINAQRVPERIPRKSRRDPFGFRQLEPLGLSQLPKSDGTRTHDVQLGKEAEDQRVSGVRAHSSLKTRCSMREWSGISRPFRRRTGPTTGPGLLRRAAPANRNAESMAESSHCQTRRPVSMSRK